MDHLSFVESIWRAWPFEIYLYHTVLYIPTKSDRTIINESKRETMATVQMNECIYPKIIKYNPKWHTIQTMYDVL